MAVEKDINEGDRLLERLGKELGNACAVIVTERHFPNGERHRQTIVIKDLETARDMLGLRSGIDIKADPTGEMSLPHLVILIHGINTRAEWMGTIGSALESAGFHVEPTSYGKFGLFSFLTPLPYMRRNAIERVATDIRTAVALYKEKWTTGPEFMCVISHSFGTYIVSKILLRYPDIRWHRIIFCGSVLKDNFRFQNVLTQFKAPLLNEVGTKDYWPAIAESVAWGCGAAGSYSLNRPGVRTRWHHGLSHSDFLNEQFCTKFWLPFLERVEGDNPKSADKAVGCPLLIRLVAMIPFKLLPLVLGLFAIWLVARNRI